MEFVRARFTRSFFNVALLFFHCYTSTTIHKQTHTHTFVLPLLASIYCCCYHHDWWQYNRIVNDCESTFIPFEHQVLPLHYYYLSSFIFFSPLNAVEKWRLLVSNNVEKKMIERENEKERTRKREREWLWLQKTHGLFISISFGARQTMSSMENGKSTHRIRENYGNLIYFSWSIWDASSMWRVS